MQVMSPPACGSRPVLSEELDGGVHQRGFLLSYYLSREQLIHKGADGFLGTDGRGLLQSLTLGLRLGHL